jgi:hypothetical protein
MRKTLIIAAAALALALSRGAIAAEADPTSNEIISGEVTKIDTATNRITVRSADGIIHEFEAAKVTLDELKVGDAIKAKKRPEPR